MQEKTFRLGEYIWLLQSTSGNHFDSLLPKNNNEYVISTLYILFYIILFIVNNPILFFFVSLTYISTCCQAVKHKRADALMLHFCHNFNVPIRVYSDGTFPQK